MTFGERLRFLREEAEMSQAQLGVKMGVQDSTVSQWESEKRQPSLDLAKKLADLFDVPVDFLMGEYDASAESIADLRAFLRTSRDLTPEELRSLLAFARFVKARGPQEGSDGPDDPVPGSGEPSTPA